MTFVDRAAARPVVIVCASPHQQVKDTTIPCSVLVIAVIWLGKISWRLAQAVQLLAYEWRQALGGFDVAARTASVEPATLAAVDGALEHWRELLVQIDYFDPKVPRKLMPRLQQLLNRAELSNDEVQILRGIARAAQLAGRDRGRATRRSSPKRRDWVTM